MIIDGQEFDLKGSVRSKLTTHLKEVVNLLVNLEGWQVETLDDARALRDDLMKAKYWLEDALDETKMAIRNIE